MQSRKSNKKSPALWFDSLEAVVAFAGDDYEVAGVPPAGKLILNRRERRSRLSGNTLYGRVEIW
jgi:hypothetical protein